MAARTLRIVALGDSVTAGEPGFRSPLESPPDGAGDPESQYGFWMSKAHPDWVVLNRGVSGERSDQILKRFERDVLREAPDYVIILAGVNDIYQGLPASFVQENLDAMYDRAADSGVRVVAATILPYNSASAGESGAIRKVNRWIEGTARHRGLAFCDVHRAVADPASYDRLASTIDGDHPDVAGYRAMGAALASAIDAHARAEGPG